ncbi:dimethylaniline monooxygenase [N-oxide-forming] 2-like [Stegodyphus dumicola]|uniref:dimethylaniline monooxygenase [N-oxide-forming] 2-like n=1 Tax=Stegodyphus dumicola TaxID=202533 RepID=UPI0015B00A7A|nr:dimethylaniline monooxygenase [N-oxide-forming] 2-like [Stegodyphus dumicola]
MECKKRIAIIGAGYCGMTAIATLKEEGLEPVCFERTSKPGGTWCYREEIIDGVASVMSTTIINHSKEMGAYSNFPPRKEFNNYMKHSELYEYFTEYWTKNDCYRHIHFNMEAVSVKRANDYDETGRWEVTVRDTVAGKETRDIYDGVMVCIGHFNRPTIPQFSGLESFKGNIVHTHSLKDVSKFKDQKVVVVGFGASALDAAVELSSVAKKVYLSTKTGAHVMTRVSYQGYPLDYVLLRRYMVQFIDLLPTDLVSWYVETFYLNPKFSPSLYKVTPKYHLLSKDPVINDHLFSKLLSGSIVQKSNIDRFVENGVIFQREDKKTEVDTVIMATGYTWKFPFLEEDIITQTDGRINLYKLMYPPHLKHPTLAFIGFLLVFGPGFPLGEMQCRWAAYMFAGKGKLPSEEIMFEDIRRRHKLNEQRYAPSDRMTLRVDYTQYLDEIASQFDVKPNLFKIFFTDFPLFCKLVFGPSVPYQYRLEGPHKWDGAREAIMKCEERILAPLHGNS